MSQQRAPRRFDERWRLSRAGIVNIWHYLDNEFDLSGGRMILRGTNGSGKSRALEMLLPFLLDADRRRMDATECRSRVASDTRIADGFADRVGSPRGLECAIERAHEVIIDCHVEMRLGEPVGLPRSLEKGERTPTPLQAFVRTAGPIAFQRQECARPPRRSIISGPLRFLEGALNILRRAVPVPDKVVRQPQRKMVTAALRGIRDSFTLCQ